jgi:hypothetical protein
MRSLTCLLTLILWPLSALAEPALVEPPDFPSDQWDTNVYHPASDCFQLAAGSIEPGDVDWVQVVIPFHSLQTVIDVDITTPEGNSLLLTWIVGGSVSFNINDQNAAADNLCSAGASTGLSANPNDSALDIGGTPEGTIIDIGITGHGDFGFIGDHPESFDYEVWVFAFAEETGCLDDAECDDGVSCTGDTCDVASGDCFNVPDDTQCDNDVFCDGTETCDALGGCQPGETPCLPEELCDELDGCYSGAGPALDIKPGGCPNFVNRRSQGYLKMALLGSAGFDVDDIDFSTVVLSRADGLGGTLHLPGWEGEPNVIHEDVSSPAEGEACECESRAPDGFVDALIRFRTPRVDAELRLNEFERGDTVELTIRGETYDGTSFTASDCIKLIDVPKWAKKKARH